MRKLAEDITWTLKLYGLTLVIPLALSVMNILICGILGVVTKFGFWMNFKIIWLDYYITGTLLDVEAWRWHLGILFIAFVITKSST